MQQQAMYRSLVVAGLAVLAANARGSIVFQDIQDIHFQTGSPQEISGSFAAQLDLNADGVDDLQLGLGWDRRSPAYWTDATPLGAGSGLVNLSAAFHGDGAENLSAGFPIGPDLPPPPYPTYLRQWTTFHEYLSASTEGGYYGWWGGEAYLGVRIGAADGARYGWVSMSASSGHLDIYSFAYETELDTPIAAGAIPAPGGWLLGVGYLAATGFRRTRRSAGQPPID